MSTYVNRLEIFQGNSKTLYCQVVDASGTALDLTGYAASFYAQKYDTNTDGVIDISINATSIDSPLGTILFDIATNVNNYKVSYSNNLQN